MAVVAFYERGSIEAELEVGLAGPTGKALIRKSHSPVNGGVI
jgi:hypothetical protein